MTKVSVIGSGRWGTFLAWYVANYCKSEEVKIYSKPDLPDFIELKETRKNQYLTLTDNMFMHEKIEDVLDNDFIIISIGCQHLR